MCSSRHSTRHRRLNRFMVTSELYMLFEIVYFSLRKAARSKTLFHISRKQPGFRHSCKWRRGGIVVRAQPVPFVMLFSFSGNQFSNFFHVFNKDENSSADFYSWVLRKWLNLACASFKISHESQNKAIHLVLRFPGKIKITGPRQNRFLSFKNDGLVWTIRSVIYSSNNLHKVSFTRYMANSGEYWTFLLQELLLRSLRLFFSQLSDMFFQKRNNSLNKWHFKKALITRRLDGA